MLDGYKTKIAGVAAILGGLAQIGHVLATVGFDFNQIWQGVLIVIGGFATLGIGGKLQKIMDGGSNAEQPPAGQ